MAEVSKVIKIFAEKSEHELYVVNWFRSTCKYILITNFEEDCCSSLNVSFT